MKRYLYGKKQYLSAVVGEMGQIRFSDIIHYGRNSNENMRDDEARKVFHLDRKSYRFIHDGIRVDPASLASDPVLTALTPRAFCLCLSRKRDDADLYKRFDADICIELDVEKLSAKFTEEFKAWPGASVLSGDVNYYPAIMKEGAPDISRLLFQKPDRFLIEDEYRIAILIPPGDSFNIGNGKSVRVYSDIKSEGQHLYSRRAVYGCIGEVFYN